MIVIVIIIMIFKVIAIVIYYIDLGGDSNILHCIVIDPMSAKYTCTDSNGIKCMEFHYSLTNLTHRKHPR